ncbi:hypothetical protein L249_1355 [Ophiocordyceps polyrhachis-furcata BCC 54312]|uniref:Small ribosomal subunit protein mS38 n=1 Tax=Ophiocordyceps polyrhachis-furcata BCC 54312 TaxID=1330021 RepID=A0A367LCQ3_9HYPO|nr:hypothetical protein L249_1355 [Ophiocordyceps polyrhachis-furcata BCC 54312]
MLPFSVRRAVTAASLASIGLGPASALAPTASLIACKHQRRYSSSKPSRPDNDAKDGPASRSVAASPASSRSNAKAASPASSRSDGKAASPASSRSDGKAASPTSSRSDGKAGGGEKRKRKSKEAPVNKLPCVPETHHMTCADLSLSTFFSQHRPISITHPIPRSVTNEHFAAIFTPRVKNNKPITSYENNIDTLDTSMSQMTIGSHRQQEHDYKVDVRNADGSPSNIYLAIDSMSGQFSPYRLPPLPQPTTAVVEAQSPATANAAAETASVDEPQYRKYQAIFTIEETLEPDGQYRVVAHSPRIVRGTLGRSFLERLARRQLRFDESRSPGAMQALSVRRQRKLKMKKKKYKKLQKRMRILRHRKT